MIHRQPGSNGDTNAGHVVKGSRRPGHYGVDRDHPSEFGDRPRRRRAQSAPRARSGPGSEERPRRRDALGESEGNRLMPQVIDGKGKALKDVPVPAAFAGNVSRQDATRSSARSSASWPTRAPARTRRSSATKCAAAAASRGNRRAPAARAKARSARRSGATAAWSSGRSRAATSARSTRKNAGPRCSPRSPTSFRTARSRCSRRDKLDADQDQGVRRVALRFAEGREDRRPHPGRVRRERARNGR